MKAGKQKEQRRQEKNDLGNETADGTIMRMLVKVEMQKNPGKQTDQQDRCDYPDFFRSIKKHGNLPVMREGQR